MNPSLLNKRVSILEQSTTQNSYGETESNWLTIATVWANIRPLRGRELYQANQVHSETTSKVTIRYRSGILPKMRINYSGRILEIIAPPINISEENRFLEILCKELI